MLEEPEMFLGILRKLEGQFLAVMFLECISNPHSKFRNVTCEIEEFPSKKLEIFLNNSESKKKKRERLGVGFGPTISRLEVEHANHCTELDLF